MGHFCHKKINYGSKNIPFSYIFINSFFSRQVNRFKYVQGTEHSDKDNMGGFKGI